MLTVPGSRYYMREINRDISNLFKLVIKAQNKVVLFTYFFEEGDRVLEVCG